MVDMSKTLGVPIDLMDKHGEPVHVGDVIRFDEKEWGGPHTFTVQIKGGEILLSGAPGDMDEYCEVIQRWDGTVLRP